MNVNVEPAEYQRLLGYPRGAAMSGRALELAAWACEWYARHGTPWIHERHIEDLAGHSFASDRLNQAFLRAEADAAVLVAVSAGGALEEEAQKLWREEKPDEYFFLEIFGSAVVERLVTMAGARLCEWADERSLAVLPHFSPGCEDWDIAGQRPLFEAIGATPGPLEVLASGALRPKKSQLAVFGLTRHGDRVHRLTTLSPCQSCSFSPCRYRRAPYGRQTYVTNPKALKRWAAERLSLDVREGGVEARFRYDGTTCTNQGRPLAFEYRVTLGPRDQGYPIRQQHCAPVAGDTGHQAMCEYITAGPELMAAIGSDQPLNGHPLEDVLCWQRPSSPAGCYCDSGARDHKWGLVLETIHYALAVRNS